MKFKTCKKFYLFIYYLLFIYLFIIIYLFKFYN